MSLKKVVIAFTSMDNVEEVENKRFGNIPAGQKTKKVIDDSLVEFTTLAVEAAKKFKLESGNYIIGTYEESDWERIRTRNEKIQKRQMIKERKRLKELFKNKTPKTFEINGVNYKLSRIDVQKYNEATIICENAGNETVKINAFDTQVDLTIEEAKNVVKTLSEALYNGYWVKEDFIREINEAVSLKQLKEIKNKYNI
jgi:hypothetical protein